MARPEGDSSNFHDALFETLENWNTELKRIDSPALRRDGEAKL